MVVSDFSGQDKPPARDQSNHPVVHKWLVQKTNHLNGIRSGAMWDASSVEEEEGGKENGLLKLTKHPVATSDAPEQVEDGPNEEIDIEDGVDGERILEEATCAYQ